MAKSNTSEQINHFKEYHEYLKEHDKIEFISTIETICQVLGISTPTYYRVLKNPQQLSIADKKAIAGVYKLPEHFLFPELKQTA